MQHFIPDLILLESRPKFLVIMIDLTIVLNGYHSDFALRYGLYHSCSILDAAEKLVISDEHRG